MFQQLIQRGQTTMPKLPLRGTTAFMMQLIGAQTAVPGTHQCRAAPTAVPSTHHRRAAPTTVLTAPIRLVTAAASMVLHHQMGARSARSSRCHTACTIPVPTCRPLKTLRAHGKRSGPVPPHRLPLTIEDPRQPALWTCCRSAKGLSPEHRSNCKCTPISRGDAVRLCTVSFA